MRASKSDVDSPTISFIKSILDYDPLTGEFRNRVDRAPNARAGQVAGNRVKVGKSRVYWELCVSRRTYYAHILAMFYMTGKWPPNEVDHLDGNGLNNAFDNLRNATTGMNQHNRKKAQSTSKTGVIGVQRVASKIGDRFSVRIKVNMKRIYLGTYADLTTAGDAYLAAKRQLHSGNLL